MCYRMRASRLRLTVFAFLVVVVLAVAAGCSSEQTEPAESGNGSSAGPGSGTGAGERYPELEGLVFVRQGAIWTVEAGIARQVIESDAPWSLRDTRSGDAITYAALADTGARIYTAVKGDWRAEPIWETDLGSLLVEVTYDDIADALWFSASGEQTTTIGVRDSAGRESTVPLPVEIAPSFSVGYEDGTLYATGDTQEPAVLYEVSATAREVFSAATLFYPRLSPDGASVLATGSERGAVEFHLWMVEIGAGAVTDLEVGPGVPTDPVWSHDGRRIAFRDTTTGTVWAVPAGDGSATDTGLEADEGGLAW